MKVYLNGSPATSGTSLDGRTVRHLNARQRACLAANILATPGQFHFAVSQLANLLHVSPVYIGIARKMSVAKRAAIIAGHDAGSFVPLLNLSKLPLALPAPKALNGVRS
jgi:hypothetical protein